MSESSSFTCAPNETGFNLLRERVGGGTVGPDVDVGKSKSLKYNKRHGGRSGSPKNVVKITWNVGNLVKLLQKISTSFV